MKKNASTDNSMAHIMNPIMSVVSGGEITLIIFGLKRSKKNRQIRIVQLLGNGPSFCAGGDLNWMRSNIGKTPKIRLQQQKDSKLLADMLEAIFQCRLPVLALAHGNIMGGGLGLLAVCDIIALVDGSRLAFSETKLGLVPSIISPYILCRTIPGMVAPWMLSAETFTPAQARAAGLVQHIDSLDGCQNYLQQQRQLLLANGPEALSHTKNLLRQLCGGKLSWNQQRQLTIKLNATIRRSNEGQEGMQAFLEKRPATWKNSSTGKGS
jgi:methylglutaconyl-CoA hydratase